PAPRPMTYLIDLDECVLRTGHLRPYLHTREGRRHIAQHPDLVKTEENPGMIAFVNQLRGATIITNSPRDYATALMNKHGINAGLIGAAGKPFATGLPDEYVIVGDACTDILQGRRDGQTAIGMSEGYNTETQLGQSGACAIAHDADELEDLIIAHQRGRLATCAAMPQSELTPVATDVDIHALGAYHPFNQGECDGLSAQIMAFKDAKNYTIERINSGATRDYFHGGRVRTGENMLTVINSLLGTAVTQLDEMEPGLLIAMPNSLPDYCYRTDINSVFTRNLGKRTKHDAETERSIRRVSPVSSAHTGGTRAAHSETLSVEVPETEHIILFDDVATSGTSLRTAAGLLRAAGYEGKISALTLGRT
ncbi:MAG: hypothetical protein ABIH41_06555, partial [Nanoarchaeota archaeon]